MPSAPDAIIERDAHQCTWMHRHCRCREVTELHVHEATTPGDQDRTLCDPHERELQTSERRRFARLNF
jgi:hypothetical protein